MGNILPHHRIQLYRVAGGGNGMGIQLFQRLKLGQDVGKLLAKGFPFRSGQGDPGQGGNVFNVGAFQGHPVHQSGKG